MATTALILQFAKWDGRWTNGSQSGLRVPAGRTVVGDSSGAKGLIRHVNESTKEIRFQQLGATVFTNGETVHLEDYQLTNHEGGVGTLETPATTAPTYPAP